MLDPAAPPVDAAPAASPVPEPLSAYSLTPDANKAVAKVLKQLLDAAKDARADFIKTRDEIKQYAYDRTFSFLYQEQDQDLFFKAKIAKAAEFLEIMGAALYPSNPEAAVNTFEFASLTQRLRHKTEKDYCDYAWRHGDMTQHGSRLVHDGLLGGRGVVWTGYNGRKKIVQSVHDTVDNLLIDADAKTKEEVNWVARRRIKPRWMLMKLYPEARDTIARLEKHTDSKSNAAKGSGNHASDLIEYHEVYMRVGLANYSPDMLRDSDPATQQAFADDAPKKYVVACDYLLEVGEWEIPFFHGDMWPCEWFDPLQGNCGLWPTSPLETGLGHLKALNWIYTLYLSKMRVTTRTPLVVANINGQGLDDDAIVKILKGKDLDIVRVTINGDVLKLSDLVQQFKFDTGVEEFERFVSIVGSAFEKATGLYEVLYTGTTPTQIRNATTADMIRNASSSRINNMQVRMEQFMARLALKTMFAARYLESPEDIAAKFGPQAAETWGVLAPPEQVQMERQQREMLKAQLQQTLTMQASMPVPGPMGPMPPAPPDPAVIAGQVEAQLGPEMLVSLEDWLNEASRDVQAGSMRPMNPQAQVDNLNVALNQLAPAVATIPGGAEFVAHISVEFARLNKYSLEFQEAAKKFAAQAAQVTQAQVMAASMPPLPPSTGTPEKGPQTGPEGGK